MYLFGNDVDDDFEDWHTTFDCSSSLDENPSISHSSDFLVTYVGRNSFDVQMCQCLIEYFNNLPKEALYDFIKNTIRIHMKSYRNWHENDEIL